MTAGGDMIRLRRGEQVFIQRVAGIAVRRGRILLHKEAGAPYWSLPGGRTHLGEPSPDTLRREMREEIGVDVEVGPLAFVIENFFRERDVVHELGLYYRMTLPEDFPEEGPLADFEGSEPACRLVFRWFRRADLESVPVYPTFLRQALKKLPAHPVHVVHRDAVPPGAATAEPAADPDPSDGADPSD